MSYPNLQSFPSIAPMKLQPYVSYIPNAFDEELTILEKMNKTILYLNQIGEITNDVVSQWNTVVDWLMNEDLTDIVNAKLDAMVDDGTLAKLINEDLFGPLNQSIIDLTNEYNDLKNNFVWRTVKQDGAKGDGTTDDFAAIQKSLNTYTHVYVPEGTYVVTAQLTINKNTHFKLHPNAVLLRAHNDDLLTNYDTVSGGYNGNGNIIIEGGIFNMNGNVFSDVGTGISMAHGDGITLRDLTILDTPYGHALEITGSQNVLVDHVKFLGFITDADHYYVEAIQVETSGPPPTGATYTYPYVTDGTTSKNIIVQNCYFGPSPSNNAHPAGVGSHGAIYDHFHDNIVVKNNHFFGNSYWSIRPFKWRNTVIDGNIIENGAGGGIYIVTPDGGLSIQDINHVTQTAQALNGFIVSNNVITSMGGTGIFLQGSTGADIYDFTIKNNVIKGMSGYGIHSTYAHNGVIEGNILETITLKTIVLDNVNNLSVNNNIINSVLDNGVFLTASTHVNFLNNVMNNLGYYGFNISGDNNQITINGNRIKNCSQNSAGTYAGILLTAPANFIVVINNVVRTDTGFVSPSWGLNVNSGVTNLTRFGNDFRCNGSSGSFYDPNASVTSSSDM